MVIDKMAGTLGTLVRYMRDTAKQNTSEGNQMRNCIYAACLAARNLLVALSSEHVSY